ncbi:MAG: PEP-CTERM sorting domain-containing protein [Pseudomonadota bacterium]|nr:PEP-CTERM sorting domain-containing protein [Pseudomonadota bacterium]
MLNPRSNPVPVAHIRTLPPVGAQRRHSAVRNFALVPVLAAFAVSLVGTDASAVDFTISGSSTAGQTLGTAAGQTGTVTATGTLTVSGSTNAVTISGNNATLTNLGTIKQTGTGRVIRDNTGVTGLTVTNGSLTNSSALMQSADGDVFQMNVSGGSVILHNYGTMSSLNASASGAQAVDFSAITTGANTVNNYAGGLLKALEADAVRTGVNGVVNNWGSILSVTTTGSSSDGVDFQNNSGAQITNYSAGAITGGRHGITGGALNSTVSFVAAITNQAGGNILGSNGSGINLDGFNNKQLVTIVNSGTIRGTGITGDGDGIDVDGLVNITNSGIIRSTNSFSAVAAGVAYSEGITVGGGTIVNSGTIEGLVSVGNTNALGRGITLAGNDITTGPLAGTREGIYGNAVITNNSGGLIRGQNDSAIVVEGAASIYNVTITNNAGATIQGGSATAAAIRTGLDSATITNRGTIDGSSSGRAIAMGAGNNTLNILGGQASILGDVSGGVGGTNTIVIHPGAGNSFSYSGSLSNFNTVEVQSGTVTLSGVSNYTGSTTVSGGTLVLGGANRLSSSSALALNGGTLKLTNAAGANGQTFSSLLLNADSAIDLGGSSLTFNALGTIAGGRTLTLFDYVMSLSPGYAIRILGDVSANSDFLALMSGLTIDGVAAGYHFDGTYTDIAPVPLPPSVVLFLAGLGLFGVVIRRRETV